MYFKKGGFTLKRAAGSNPAYRLPSTGRYFPASLVSPRSSRAGLPCPSVAPALLYTFSPRTTAYGPKMLTRRHIRCGIPHCTVPVQNPPAVRYVWYCQRRGKGAQKTAFCFLTRSPLVLSARRQFKIHTLKTAHRFPSLGKAKLRLSDIIRACTWFSRVSRSLSLLNSRAPPPNCSVVNPPHSEGSEAAVRPPPLPTSNALTTIYNI